MHQVYSPRRAPGVFRGSLTVGTQRFILIVLFCFFFLEGIFVKFAGARAYMCTYCVWSTVALLRKWEKT